MAKERVQKIIARLGLISRRGAEEWITEGLVTINGKKAKLGDQAELGVDSIKVKGKLLQSTDTQSGVYFAFHKPKGVICAMGADPQGRITLEKYVSKINARLFPIGRLEYNQEGLLILTNDGEFADKLRRSPDVIRGFHLKVNHDPKPEELESLSKGMRVEGKLIQPYSVKLLERYNKKALIELAIQGMGAFDLKTFMQRKSFLIDRMILNSIGQIKLGGLKPGEYRVLKKSQVETLLDRPELGKKLIENTRSLAPTEPKLEDEEGVERAPLKLVLPKAASAGTRVRPSAPQDEATRTWSASERKERTSRPSPTVDRVRTSQRPSEGGVERTRLPMKMSKMRLTKRER